ncbi:MAG: SH3 domain-containing C40 family peptidase [Clostridium sp.]|nr:SH3 domain-containing C40 family peptidase [Clostridium sp.]
METLKYAAIIKAVAALRGEPCKTSERIDEVLFGMDAEIISKMENGWYYINTFYDYSGYINEKDILLLSEDEYKIWKEKSVYYISKDFADILEEPKYNSKIIITLTRGAFLSVTGEVEGYWSKVELVSGKFGWIRTKYVNRIEKLPKSDEKEIRERIVKTAQLYMDTQYRWGGKSSFGIDCSGICSMAYMLNGFIIYRDAELKEKYMRSIDIKDVKKGDLIFFDGHVAMYIDKGKFIHSNGKYGGVCINSFNIDDEDYRQDLENSIIGIGSIF